MGIQKNSSFKFPDNRAFIFLTESASTTMEEFVDNLDIPFQGEMMGEEYVVTLANSDEFSELYNIISTNKILNIKNDSTANDSEARFCFEADGFDVGMLADFDDDIYKMVVSRN